MLKDRCDVFKQICRNSKSEMDMDKVDSIYEENYENFCDISDEVIGDADVEELKCEIDKEGKEITFEIIGKEKTRTSKMPYK